MLTITTLGPEGSNHELVAGRYAQSIGIAKYRLVLLQDFHAATALLKRGGADCMVQCAAHPDVAKTIGSNLNDVFVVDTFIAASKPLAVLVRRDAEHPTCIGFHPATREYVDLSRWQLQVEEQSTVKVAEALLAGRYDSGITALEVAERHPEKLRVDAVIGSAQDAWLVYAANSVYAGEVIAWRESPGARFLRALAAESDGSQREGQGFGASPRI